MSRCRDRSVYVGDEWMGELMSGWVQRLMDGWLQRCRDRWMDGLIDAGMDGWVNAAMGGWMQGWMDSCSFWRTLPLKLRPLRQDPQVKSTGRCNKMSHVLINKRVLPDEPSSESQIALQSHYSPTRSQSPALSSWTHTIRVLVIKSADFYDETIILWGRFVALLAEPQPVLINSPCFSQVPLKRKKRLMCRGEIRAELRHLIPPFRCCFVPVTQHKCFISQSVSQLSQA